MPSIPVTRRKPGTSSTKKPPILSHEFIIQNHADIVSSIALVIVVGLMFQVSHDLASMFVFLSYNVTMVQNETESSEPAVVTTVLYNNGTADIFCVLFYTMIVIIFHAIIQEYILDKVNKKLHLSKTKHIKFNESGQLFVYYCTATVFGAFIIYNEFYLMNPSNLWESYPHQNMTLLMKIYYIMQLSHWLHTLPEFYIERLKKEDIYIRCHYISLYLVFTSAAYLMNFNRIGLLLSVAHYTVEGVFHFSRLMHFSEKHDWSQRGFSVWAVMFVFVRFLTVMFTIFTFVFGLSRVDQAPLSEMSNGNFNNFIVKVSSLTAVFLLQAWLMWNFITFQMKRWRDEKQSDGKKKSSKTRTGGGDRGSKKKSTESNGVVTVDNGSPRQRTSPKSKHN